MKLPSPDLNGLMALEAALAGRRSVRDYADKPITVRQVSQLLWAAQGITHKEERRAAPSAGALYPLEVHLAVGNVEGIEAGIYRYDPKSHALNLSAVGDFRTRIAADALAQEWIAAAAVILVLTGVAARMTPKYGERSGRYIMQETGHAAQNVLLQVIPLGLGAAPVGAFRAGALRRTLCLDEGEAPQYIIPVGYEKI